MKLLRYIIPSTKNFSFVTIITFLSLVHPCDRQSNGGCSQICNKTKLAYECACEEGFALEKDRKTCVKG